MPKENILIIEDEKEIADLIEIYLVNRAMRFIKPIAGKRARF